MIPLVDTWHLFGDVYFKNCWTLIPFTNPRKYYRYYHKCTERLRVALIDKSGTCSNCSTYLVPYKKLETINGLLDIYS